MGIREVRPGQVSHLRYCRTGARFLFDARTYCFERQVRGPEVENGTPTATVIAAALTNESTKTFPPHPGHNGNRCCCSCCQVASCYGLPSGETLPADSDIQVTFRKCPISDRHRVGTLIGFIPES